jgi:uncharacterized protein (TIGR03083 family)
VEYVELYHEGRMRAIELARSLEADDAHRPVPTCPAWTVKDVFAHLAGTPADVMAGRLEGVTTDPWTARQVEERAGRTLDEIVEELEAIGPPFEDAMRALGKGVDSRLLIDQWTHEQDVRGAVGQPGGRDAAVVAWSVGKLVPGLGRAWGSGELAPVRVAGESGEWVLGDGEPVATMRASDFELARILVGRRSRAQALATWDGDGEPFIDHLVAFTFTPTDILE